MGASILKAMLLAAGQGKRMGALTKETPKPLLLVAGKPLIQHHIEELSACGVTEFVINLHYLGDKIRDYLGDGSQFDVSIKYSLEEKLLGMGGGIQHALSLLGDEPFIVLSNDVWTDFPFERFLQPVTGKAHLVLVDNPPFHPNGDFSLENNYIIEKNGTNFNYAGFGVFSPEIFLDHEPGEFGITSVLKPLLEQQQVTGEYYAGMWHNINTADDLAYVNKNLV